MSVMIKMSQPEEDALRAEWGDLEQAAKEALLIESYRQGKVSVGFLAQSLNMGVIEADQWLAERGVSLNYSRENLREDQRTIESLFRITI
jgi:predicted HTH domain antitoxin